MQCLHSILLNFYRAAPVCSYSHRRSPATKERGQGNMAAALPAFLESVHEHVELGANMSLFGTVKFLALGVAVLAAMNSRA